MTVEKSTSHFVQSQFPGFYNETGTFFITFCEEYFKWFEENENTGYFQKNLLDFRDIDTTLDSFIIHFKEKYLKSFPYITNSDKRFFIKHVLDFYRSKGTPRSVEILFKTLYDEEINVYYPGDDIFKLSAATWITPIYLEVTISPRTNSYISKYITGTSSKASAFVESVHRRRIHGKYIDVVMLSNIKGKFIANELITEDGLNLLTEDGKIIIVD